VPPAFLYAFGALYGAGTDTIFWGFLLLVAGVPLHVWIKFANRPRHPGG
jgi:APA family basic amino acid/polyamine antiporter